MKLSKLSAVAVLAAMTMGSQAHALDLALTTTGVAAAAAGYPVAGGVILLSATGLELTATAARSKDAAKAAAPDAVEVLKGGEATDTFKAGRAGAEALLNVQFQSDADAAVAILEITEASSQE